jgi:hypothetical protein
MHPTLSQKAFPLALGCTWAIGLAALALIAMVHGSYGKTVISILSSVYLGYAPTVPGIVIGALWGFVDGYIGGYIFTWFYNYFLQQRG